MTRCTKEFSLDDVLSDTLTRAVMDADGVDPEELRQTLTRLAATIAGPGTKPLEYRCNLS